MVNGDHAPEIHKSYTFQGPPRAMAQIPPLFPPRADP
ncbi:similar to An08g12160 [Aspergillus luchuensis]|uniref:Similar to An08g12160 n=1 Tax=Aspergillus kawachii TaxID=1069201 RepID=A0A146F9P0_ASPKA|nr:similar to An08g12160 [Aspergillus luchuensis]